MTQHATVTDYVTYRPGDGAPLVIPTGPIDVELAADSATLSWIAPPDPDVAGFRVYYGASSGNYVQAVGSGVDIGQVTTYTVNGLVSGKSYYFAVSAYDVAGNESPLSGEASKLVR